MTKKTHEQLIKTALSKPKVQKEYALLHEEFELYEQLIKARLKSGKTQEEVARAMRTSTSVVGRLETGGGKHKHSPTIDTLRRYAKALGFDLKIQLVQHRHHV